MNGKTGRLYKKLVEERGIAKSSGGGGRRMMGGGGLEVQANQESMKYAGAFQISAEGVSGVRAEQLEEAMVEVLDDLAERLAHVGVDLFLVLVDRVGSAGLILRRWDIDVVGGLQIDTRDRALAVVVGVEPRALGRDPH